MKILKTDFDKTGIFSSLFLDYVAGKSEVSPFYNLPPSLENFKKQTEITAFSEEKRKLLVEVLLNQYHGFEISAQVKENIYSLSNQNTFTITTGHQLNLFSGPLYFIYKIITVVNACKKLKATYPGFNFVPVFWMASEDHDVEEINHFCLFNKKLVWETDQKGAVGRFQTTGIEKIFSEIKEALPLFEKAYLEHKTLSEATRYFVNELFGGHGLVIIDGDNRELKTLFDDIVTDELIHQTSYKKITETSQRLKDAGYGLQINPREINLFYLRNGIRERIVKEGKSYKILGQDLELPEEEMLALSKYEPEVLSPNVALRPLYQQIILPNIAYCGGPAEIGYWLQLKSLFDYYKIAFPVLLPRLSALIINETYTSKLDKLGFSPEEIFMSNELLKEKMLIKISDNIYTLEEEKNKIGNIFSQIKNKAVKIDSSLEDFVSAEKQKVEKLIEGIEKKLKKAEENKNEASISQLLNIKTKLFPNGQLQERRDNFLNFFINDPAFINNLLKLVDPFDFRFNIVIKE